MLFFTAIWTKKTLSCPQLHRSQNLFYTKFYSIINVYKGAVPQGSENQNDIYEAKLYESYASAGSQQSVSQSSYQGIYWGYQRCGDSDLEPLWRHLAAAEWNYWSTPSSDGKVGVECSHQEKSIWSGHRCNKRIFVQTEGHYHGDFPIKQSPGSCGGGGHFRMARQRAAWNLSPHMKKGTDHQSVAVPFFSPILPMKQMLRNLFCQEPVVLLEND